MTSTSTGMSTGNRPMKAFVQLAYGFGGENWRARWDAGRILGINEPQAYGYHRAAGPDVTVVYAEDAPERRLQKLVRLGVRAVLGFDLVHAWRNRHAMLAADTVWTHTESQTLAVLAVLRIMRPLRAPKMVGQVVWLIDRWKRQPWPRRMLFRWLLRRLDLMTVHSSLNLADARALFPGLRIEQVHFGIRADTMRAPVPRIAAHPLRLASLGSDEHRDWETLAAAVGQLNATDPGAVELRVGSKSPAARKACKGLAHVAVIEAKTNDALLDLYDSADLVIVPLMPNRHASGITVIAEALLRGIAVIATDVGGLRDYFDETAICYVPARDPRALAGAIAALGADAGLRKAMVLAGQRRIRAAINSQAYALRHVALSRELLGMRPMLPARPRIAIGIATSGRPAILAALIDDLAHQTLRPETIVISHAAPSDVAEVSLAGWADGTIRFIAGMRGLPMQRNAILERLGTEDIVLFLDDDFFPHPTYLEEMARVFHADATIVGATGRVIADGARGPGLQIADAGEMLAAFVPDDVDPVAAEDVFNTYGCNMAFRIDAVRESGVRFDERLPLYAWYEDMDFSRALRASGRIVRARHAVGVHLGNKSGKTSGLRLGYSQIANPLYLARKGTYPWDHALRSAGRHLLINIVRSFRPEAHIDRRGRARGNALAILDLLRGRIAPERVVTLSR